MASYVDDVGPNVDFLPGAAWTDIPDMSITVASRPGPVLIIASGNIENRNVAAQTPSVGIAVDGVQPPGAYMTLEIAAGLRSTYSFARYVANVVPGQVITGQLLGNASTDQAALSNQQRLTVIALPTNQALTADLISP